MNHMLKSTFKISFLLVAIISLSSCVNKEPQEQAATTTTSKPNPNIIIFYVDDLGFGDVSPYGAKNITTPNVDALANNGL